MEELPLSLGTTWMQEIITLILSRGDPRLSHTVPNWARAPWLEHHYFADLQEASLKEPRVFTTHLPGHLLGPALQKPPGSSVKVFFCSGSSTYSVLGWICDLLYFRCVRSQVIYVSRNPKDVAVSFFHFHKLATFLPEFSTFQEFLHHFLDGTCEFKINWIQKPMLSVSIRCVLCFSVLRLVVWPRQRLDQSEKSSGQPALHHLWGDVAGEDEHSSLKFSFISGLNVSFVRRVVGPAWHYPEGELLPAAPSGGGWAEQLCEALQL